MFNLLPLRRQGVKQAIPAVEIKPTLLPGVKDNREVKENPFSFQEKQF